MLRRPTPRRVTRAVTIALAVGLLSPQAAQAVPPSVPDTLRAFSHIPPGQDGSLHVGDVLQGGGPHVKDQLEMYASLPDDPDIAEDELPTYFHSMQFAPATIESTLDLNPAADATIYRDGFGVPHVYGATLDDVAYALGYATGQDRLWQADVFRHAARGELAEILGPDYAAADLETRREGYTEAEVTSMLDALDDRFGAEGAQVQSSLVRYADGINAFIGDTAPDPPLEYAGTSTPFPPDPWTPNDTAYLTVLQLRALGETAGAELHNAALFKHLRKRLGRRIGTRVFEDLLTQNNRRSPTSVPTAEGRYPSQDLGAPKKASYVIPDDPASLLRRVERRTRAREAVLEELGLRGPASNMLAVSASESATGHPLMVAGPQVGYTVPSFFMDISVQVPSAGIHVRGPAIPGAALLVPVGRGEDYAWSLTTGVSDAVDVRAERLCEPGGGTPTIGSDHFLFNGTCTPMSTRVETIGIKGSSPEVHEIDRTVHGPVFARGTVKGDPVAFVRERFFWMKELDSTLAFYRWNTSVDSVEDFAAAAELLQMSFNAEYVDADHVAYFHLGAYPVRRKGHHPLLPTWGTGEWEWQGRFPFSSQPRVVDPRQGWLVNWNSKPSAGWDTLDTFKWGAVQRVELLEDGLRPLVRKAGTVELSELVQVMADAATRDARAVYLGRRMVRWGSEDAGTGVHAAIGRVRRWIRSGSNRENLDRDETMDQSPALAFFDVWFDELVHRIFDDELGAGFYELAGDLVRVTDYAPRTGSSFFFDFSSYVRDLFGKRSARNYALPYCDRRATRRAETCADQVARAAAAALKILKKEQGSPSRWEVGEENLVFQAFGGITVDPIPWQNRGTHTQAIEVLGEAP